MNLKKMKINEYILKISSAGVNLPKPLELGKRYLLSTEVDIIETIDKDKNDGEIDRIYKARQTGNIDILTEGKTIIKATEKKKVSQSIHGSVWYFHNMNGLVEDFDEYYQRIGKKISAYMPEIIEFLNSKN